MKKYFPYASLTVAIVISFLLWDFIKFPYDNENTIIGEYSVKKFNPLNDTVRGIFFIFFPLLIYTLVQLRFNRDQYIINKKILDTDYPNFYTSQNINLISIILILFVIIEFFSLNYLNFISNIDVHHEGTYLSAPINYLFKDGLWLATHFDYGLIGNNINLIFSNYVGEISIGQNRFIKTFLILINKILIILLCRKIIINTKEFKNKNLVFFIFSFVCISLADFNENVNPFHPRIFIFLIFFLFLIEILTSDKKKFSSIIVGLFSSFSAIFYFDIGVYINAIIIISLIFLIYLKKYENLIFALSGLVLSWVIFYIFLPKEEIIEFFYQYNFIINISDYLLGIEFPKPFSDGATRHTKALLLIIFAGIFLFNFLFSKDVKENSSSKLILLFLFISSIIFFKSGLMRSDNPHIKYTSGIYTLIFLFFTIFFIYRKIKSNKFFIKVEKLFLDKKKIIILIISVFFIYNFKNHNNNLNNIGNIFDSNKNFYALTKVPDKKFLDKRYIEFLNSFKKISNKDKCVQSFTDDNAIPYFLKKPTCTQFYVNAHIVNGWTENKFINQLKLSRPLHIIYSSQINWFKNRNNAPNAKKFILENYSLFKKIHSWEIYKLKN